MQDSVFEGLSQEARRNEGTDIEGESRKINIKGKLSS